MKTDEVAPQKLILVGAAMLVGATLFWETRDFVPSFAATQVTASAVLATTAERDDARVLRAFAQARKAVHVEAALDPEPEPNKPVRNATLTVRAKSETDALADLSAMTDEMQGAFAQEGPGEFLVNASRKTEPVPNGTLILLSRVFRGMTLLLLLGGLGLIVHGWRRSELPKQVLWAILITICLCALYLVPDGALPAWIGVAIIVMPIPVVIAALVAYKTLEVRKAATWVTGQARITKSKTKAERHRFGGDSTQVTNKADVAYEFAVAGTTYHGTRISIGDNPADGVEAALKRYSKGASVPVFYNPANPEECVLERDPPASIGCLWTGAGVLLLIGVAISAFIISGTSINNALSTWFPSIQHPLMAIGVGLMGVFCLLMFVAGRRQAAKAASWPVTKGTIVSSTTESFIGTDSSDSRSRNTRMYKALVEYRYEVGGQEYHSNRIDLGVETATSSKAAADEKAARYPVDMEVQVHYDPKDPSSAALEITFAKGGCLVLLALLLFGVAIYVAIHA